MNVRHSIVLYNSNGPHDIAPSFPIEVSEKLVLRISQETNISGNDSVGFFPCEPHALFEDIVVDFRFSFKLDECIAAIVNANSIFLSPVISCLLFPKSRVSKVIKIQAPN